MQARARTPAPALPAMHGPRLAPARLAPRRLLAAILALLAITGGAGTALAADDPVAAPALRWPATGTAIRTAMGLAAERWGFSPCRGRVTVAWSRLDAGLNGESSWANDLDPYLQPSRNTECDITLSTAQEWDWPKVCSLVIHEMGHLAGHDHVDDPEDVMYPTYMRPERECVATPEPGEVPRPAPAPAVAAAPVPAARPRAQHAAKRASRAATKRAAAKRRGAKHPRRRR
jgi:hypothetical protein